MTFMQAVSVCFSKYVTFSGRARRAEYWWWSLFVIIASIALGIVDGAIFGMSMENVGPLGALFSLGTLLPGIAVSVRRLHDLDRTGWWLLIAFLPIIGWIVLLVFFVTKGTSGANRFGPDPLGGEDDGSAEGFASSSIPPVDRG